MALSWAIGVLWVFGDYIWSYRLRLKRRRKLWRAVRARRQLSDVALRVDRIRPGNILAFVVFRNEALRLPHFLDHYRALGVDHFLMIDNASTDAGPEIVGACDDVSLWRTTHGYRASHFGLDWTNWLLLRYGAGHWCLTVDADEIFIYPDWRDRPLSDLVEWLDRSGRDAYGALMLDMFPKGPVNEGAYTPGTDPFDHLQWFDDGPYRAQRQRRLDNLWVQGGPRDRVFFAGTPERAPTLNKLPLVRWRRPYAYMNSTHAMLPPRLNRLYDGPFQTQPGGVLLHSKFLPDISDRASHEQSRAEHFGDPDKYSPYYDALKHGPDLWHPAAKQYKGWKQLADMGLIPDGTWK